MTGLGSTRRQYRAIHTALEASGWQVGFGKVPDNHTTPYAVLYAPTEGPLGGPVSDPFADQQLMPQLSCVGADLDEALGLVDRLRPIVLGLTSLDGRPVLQVQLDVARVLTDDDLPGKRLFTAVDGYRITTTPA